MELPVEGEGIEFDDGKKYGDYYSRRDRLAIVGTSLRPQKPGSSSSITIFKTKLQVRPKLSDRQSYGLARDTGTLA
jgi:hypothetical protein